MHYLAVVYWEILMKYFMTITFEAGQQYSTLYLRVYALLERDLLNIYWSEYVSALYARCTEENTFEV
jgi:hypothetical protein